MLIEFRIAKLAETYRTGKNKAKLGHNVFRGFIRVVDILAAAPTEAELYHFKGLHFEMLSGDRKGQRSLRVNDQFRLIITVEAREEGTVAVIIEIVDYH